MGIPGSLVKNLDSARRIAVIGAVGCGKSSLAQLLAKRAHLPYVELDYLYYNAQWKKTPEQIFFDDVIRSAGASEWVIDGNYELTRDIIWIRAQLLIWLDYPLRIVLWRLMKRTFRRLVAGEVFSNGNREGFWRLFGPNSIIYWAIRSHLPRRRRFEHLLASTRYAHLRVLRLRSQREADAYGISLSRNKEKNLNRRTP